MTQGSPTSRVRPAVQLGLTLLGSLAAAPSLAALEVSHTVSCRADAPIHPGESMTWRAFVTGGSGSFTFSWTGNDNLTGSTQVVTRTYATAGFRFARVTVTDDSSHDPVTAECHSHVVPLSFSELPNVRPVLWVPHDVDPAPLAGQVARVWRSVRASFVEQYGKTFRLGPVTTVVSPSTEAEICGGDCTEIPEGNARLMAQAQQEAQAAVGTVITYTRVVHVLAWGAGGFAGSFGWDFPQTGVGDWALAAVAGVPAPRVTAEILEGFAITLGNYAPAVSTVAHELNHAIGWDDPHDFTLGVPPNDYEKQFSLAGPWLTVVPTDVTDPVVQFLAPAPGTILSGTTTVSVAAFDETGLDAVAFLVDEQLMAVDEAEPFSFQFDGTRVGFGPHRLRAIVYDDAGNTGTAEEDVLVRNQVVEGSCSGTFPAGVFHACFFEGTNLDGAYLGTLLDKPFPAPSSNVATAINHAGFGEVAFGRSDLVSGIWRGTFDFPAGNYLLSILADDGVRVRLNGVTIVDEWQVQVAGFAEVVPLSGSTRIQIEWFQGAGSYGLVVRWQPTTLEPPTTRITDLPDLVSVRTGTLRAGNAASLTSDDDAYLVVASTTTGTARTTAWVAQFTGVPGDLQDLSVSYVGKNTRRCLQDLSLWSWPTTAWVSLGQRVVGPHEAVITVVSARAPANFVSNPRGMGTIRVRVRCQGDGVSFSARGDLLKVEYLSPGGP